MQNKNSVAKMYEPLSSVESSVKTFMNYTGNFCDNCGSDKMVRTGTCETCQSCGTTSGCS